MRKIKFMFLCLLVSLFLVSCKEKQTQDSEKAQNTQQKENTANIKGLTTLNVVTDRSQFSDVTEAQIWNFETDMNQNMLPLSGIADTGEITYINCSNCLIQFPKNEYIASVACEKPDCLHIVISNQDKNPLAIADMMCEADLSVGVDVGRGLQYYEGYLYYIIKDGGIALCRISSDGKIKSQVELLSDKASGMPEQDIPWLIHRGNVYFWNFNEGICRVSLMNPASKDILIRRQAGSGEPPVLKAYGSFLYFLIPGAVKSEWIFGRYNAESEQIEQFSEISGQLSNFIVRENKIYYQIWNDNKIYEYDVASGQKEVYFELENGDYSFYADADYICLPKTDSRKKDEEGCDISADVYTWDKVYVGKIQLEKETPDRLENGLLISYETIHIIGSDSDRIYYQREKDNREYIQKSISYVDKSEITEDTILKIAYTYIPFD